MHTGLSEEFCHGTTLGFPLLKEIYILNFATHQLHHGTLSIRAARHTNKEPELSRWLLILRRLCSCVWGSRCIQDYLNSQKFGFALFIRLPQMVGTSLSARNSFIPQLYSIIIFFSSIPLPMILVIYNAGRVQSTSCGCLEPY